MSFFFLAKRRVTSLFNAGRSCERIQRPDGDSNLFMTTFKSFLSVFFLQKKKDNTINSCEFRKHLFVSKAIMIVHDEDKKQLLVINFIIISL